MKTSFTAVYRKIDDWYVAYIEELPGANTQGRTIDEARSNLREAAQLIIESNRQLSSEQCGSEETFREELAIDI